MATVSYQVSEINIKKKTRITNIKYLIQDKRHIQKNITRENTRQTLVF